MSKLLKNKYVILIIFLMFFLIIGLYDINISLSFYNPKDSFSSFLDLYGELLSPIFVFASSLIVIKLLINSNSKFLYLYFLTLSYSIVYSLYLIIYGFSLNIKSIFFTFFILLFFLAIFALIYFIPKNKLHKFKYAAIRISLVSIISLVIVLILKFLWGRVRFRDMQDYISPFTPWYKINGINGNFSFPSAHAANFSVLYGVTYLYKFNNVKIYKTILNISILLFIFILSFTRVIVGAHFFTDIVVGISITIFCFFTFDFICLKCIKNND